MGKTFTASFFVLHSRFARLNPVYATVNSNFKKKSLYSSTHFSNHETATEVNAIQIMIFQISFQPPKTIVYMQKRLQIDLLTKNIFALPPKTNISFSRYSHYTLQTLIIISLVKWCISLHVVLCMVVCETNKIFI